MYIEVHGATANSNEDQNKKKPGADGIGLPGLDVGTGITSGTTSGNTTGTTLGIGTTVSNLSAAILSKGSLNTLSTSVNLQIAKIENDLAKQVKTKITAKCVTTKTVNENSAISASGKIAALQHPELANSINAMTVSLLKKKPKGGVFSITWKGNIFTAITKKNFTVKLAAKQLMWLRKVGIGVAVSAVVALLATVGGVPAAGIAGWIFYALAKKIVTAVINEQFSKIKRGLILNIKGGAVRSVKPQ